jgi:hypothetical protein
LSNAFNSISYFKINDFLRCHPEREAAEGSSFTTMIYLKWSRSDVRFGSAQRTVVGMVDNDLFKMDWH